MLLIFLANPCHYNYSNTQILYISQIDFERQGRLKAGVSANRLISSIEPTYNSLIMKCNNKCFIIQLARVSETTVLCTRYKDMGNFPLANGVQATID